MKKDELLNLAINVPFDKLKDVPLLSGIYIVQQK